MEVYEFSVPMALVDFIPVFLFGAAAVLLLRDLYSKMVKGAYALFAAGVIDVFMAGFLKAPCIYTSLGCFREHGITALPPAAV